METATCVTIFGANPSSVFGLSSTDILGDCVISIIYYFVQCKNKQTRSLNRWCLVLPGANLDLRYATDWHPVPFGCSFWSPTFSVWQYHEIVFLILTFLRFFNFSTVSKISALFHSLLLLRTRGKEKSSYRWKREFFLSDLLRSIAVSFQLHNHITL